MNANEMDEQLAKIREEMHELTDRIRAVKDLGLDQNAEVGAAIKAGVHFALRCDGYCDAGDGIDSVIQADAAGWRNLRLDDGLSWNFLGTCRECLLEGC